MSDETAYETIRYEADGPVLTVTLNRPEKLNAYTAQMGAELADAITRADEDDAIRSVLAGLSPHCGKVESSAWRSSCTV